MKSPLLWMVMVVAGGAVGLLAVPEGGAPSERVITVRARKYGYEPSVIRVQRGDTVRLRFVSEDVVHGFYLEGHDIDVAVVPMQSTVELRRPSRPGQRELVEEVRFKADKPGKFRYRCSQTCGFMHPFMLGELIVGPNRLPFVATGLAIGLLLAVLGAGLLRGRSP